MPYRIDLTVAPDDALDRLVRLGALDVDATRDGLAAILPDGVSPEHVARQLGVSDLRVSTAGPRDDGSVWVLNPRPVRVGRLVVAAQGVAAPADALRLVDSAAFGTGMHPTTALCLEALEATIGMATPRRVLDVGTGSGVLALAALRHGVAHAVGVDVDAAALDAASQNARLNHLDGRLRLVQGGPESVAGTWPLVLANVLAAPLIEMAPVLVRRVAHQGRLVLSGIPASVASEVDQVYRRLGMRHVDQRFRSGWSVLVLDASW
jgi:ribosomal protein L11 methyltransferase